MNTLPINPFKLAAIIALSGLMSVACSRRAEKVECDNLDPFAHELQMNAEHNSKREVLTDIAVEAAGDTTALFELVALKISPSEIIKEFNAQENPEAFELDGFHAVEDKKQVITNGVNGRDTAEMISQSCNSASFRMNGAEDTDVAKIMGDDVVVETTTKKLPSPETVNDSPDTAMRIERTYISSVGKVTLVYVVRWGDNMPATEKVSSDLVNKLLTHGDRNLKLTADGAFNKTLTQALQTADGLNAHNAKLRTQGKEVPDVKAMVTIDIGLLMALSNKDWQDIKHQGQFISVADPCAQNENNVADCADGEDEMTIEDLRRAVVDRKREAVQAETDLNSAIDAYNDVDGERQDAEAKLAGAQDELNEIVKEDGELAQALAAEQEKKQPVDRIAQERTDQTPIVASALQEMNAIDAEVAEAGENATEEQTAAAQAARTAYDREKGKLDNLEAQLAAAQAVLTPLTEARIAVEKKRDDKQKEIDEELIPALNAKTTETQTKEATMDAKDAAKKAADKAVVDAEEALQTAIDAEVPSSEDSSDTDGNPQAAGGDAGATPPPADGDE